MTDITAWIQAISAAITVPITAVAIVKLFMRDKKRESEIASLVSMAEAQCTINDSFASQLAEAQKQTLVLSEANDIMEKQLRISQAYYEKDLEVTNARFEVEKALRRNAIKPFFVFDGSGGNREAHKVKIKNAGQDAFNIAVSYSECKSINFSSMNINMDKIIKNFTFALAGSLDGGVLHPEYTIHFDYEDSDGNVYSQELSRRDMKFIVSEPKLGREKEN